MSACAPPAGKRPLSDIAREAEVNGRAAKRRAPVAPQRRAPPSPFPPVSSHKAGETVYRILCPASKTGSIIGKGGSIIKSIRQDTGTMIRIEDSVFGCDERVVTVAAREEGFRPQKFRGPGNYRKSGGEDSGDDVLDTDEAEAEEQPVEGAGVESEETAVDVSVIVDEKQDVLNQTEGAGAEEQNVTEVESVKEITTVEDTIKVPGKEGENSADREEILLAGNNKTSEAPEEELLGLVAAKHEQLDEQVKDAAPEMTVADEANGHEESSQHLADSVVHLKDRGLSPVQEALLRVHLRILEADPTKPEDNHALDRGQGLVTRLLVPTSQVGCLLGKQGKIVSRMREESGAQIRVLPKDQLPTCASREDEVVQITGDLTSVRKALLAVSTQLRNNPPKRSGEDAKLTPRPVEDYPRRSSIIRAKKASGRSPPRHSLGQSLSVALPFGVEEVTYRLMCPKEKIGSIIGKGGSIVQSIREETGAKISIDVSSDVGEERVIRVSAHESREDSFSKAQRAVMILHNRILAADQDKDGLVTTKLLVPSDQAGCLLGKGGSIVIEMRKLTRAKIHIYGKEHLPPGSWKSDELVEVIGNFNASQEALMQITGRLRNNLFHGIPGPGFKEPNPPPFSGLASPSEGPLPLRQLKKPVAPPYERHWASYEDPLPTGSYSHGPWPSELKQPVQSYSQDLRSKALPEYKGFGQTRESSGEPKRLVDNRANAAFITSQTIEVIVPEHTISSIVGESGSNLQQICKISGARVKVNGMAPGALERVVEISGTPDQTHAAQSLLQAFILSGQ